MVKKRPFLAKIESTTVSTIVETMYDSNFDFQLKVKIFNTESRP